MKSLIKFFLIFFIVIISQNAKSQEYLTPWGFKINVSDDFLYLGKNNNQGRNCKFLEERGLARNTTCERFFNSLDDGRFVFIVSKKHSNSGININRQFIKATTTPQSQADANSMCSNLRRSYESMTKMSFVIKNCNLEYLNNKIDTKKFNKLNNKIKSVLYYAQEIKNYNRIQNQYFVEYEDYLATFTFGCSFDECADGNQEIVEIINSIKF
jgi:hypothetical protein